MRYRGYDSPCLLPGYWAGYPTGDSKDVGGMRTCLLPTVMIGRSLLTVLFAIVPAFDELEDLTGTFFSSATMELSFPLVVIFCCTGLGLCDETLSELRITWLWLILVSFLLPLLFLLDAVYTVEED
jgi:hypothetical protein